MWIIKGTVEKKVRKMGMKRINGKVICQCLGNGERNNLWWGVRGPQRVLKFDFSFHTVVYGDRFVQDANDQVDWDVNETFSVARDADDGILEKITGIVLPMAPDLASTMTKYTTMQILNVGRPVPTYIVSRLRCNKTSVWNLVMREQKESVSANLRRPMAVSGYKGHLGVTGEYRKKVANV